MLLHMDNFQIYGLHGEAQLTHGIYAESFGCTITADPDVNAVGTVLHVDDPAHFYRGIRWIAQVSDQVMGSTWRWWIDRIPSVAADRPAVTFLNDSSSPVVSVGINTLGGIDVREGGVNDPILASTDGPVVTASGWYAVEVRVNSVVDGSVEVRVEGRTVLLLEHVDINADLQQVFWGMWSANGPLPDCYYKDITAWNSLGTHNTDFLGSVIVQSLDPVADVSLNWTPSTGANGYSILDNRGPNDAEYIEAPYPPPAAYVCSLSALPVEITSVRGIMTIVRAAKVDGGDGSLQNGVISATVPQNGADRPITVTQTYWTDVFEEDPATNALWLPAAVNAVHMKINRTT